MPLSLLPGVTCRHRKVLSSRRLKSITSLVGFSDPTPLTDRLEPDDAKCAIRRPANLAPIFVAADPIIGQLNERTVRVAALRAEARAWNRVDAVFWAPSRLRGLGPVLPKGVMADAAYADDKQQKPWVERQFQPSVFG
ncbi:hypothetical protein ACQR1W_38145 [Bradyrhizobium sp. HKCCYLS1011]|uniref:hypothetical protein n=1 Tax=Bradyrhizobium sp. HKCCYLS1011 TaxID=3420733 RepID=UPI003EBA772A